MDLVTRNADLQDLAKLLQQQHEAKLDMVVPASSIRSYQGVLEVAGTGVFQNQKFRPTSVCDGQIADRLGVPVQYLRRLRDSRIDLYDTNVNGWISGFEGYPVELPGGGIDVAGKVGPDERKFLLRSFADEDGGEGVARALLSDSFKIIDHMDVLTAALSGVRDTGQQVEIVSCDLSETRMTVKVAAPSIARLAPKLLEGYRNPFGGSDPGGNYGWSVDSARQAAQREGKDYPVGQEPIVFAGFVLSNSETGGGAFTIVPRIIVKICKNGLTIAKDAMRMQHLGAKLDAGVVKWSDDTRQKNLELVTSMAKDAVSTFLDQDYIDTLLSDISAKADTPIQGNPADAIKVVSNKLRFTQSQQDGILEHFIRGGQVTAGGLMEAVTSFAQTVTSPDEAYDLENAALPVLEAAAAL